MLWNPVGVGSDSGALIPRAVIEAAIAVTQGWLGDLTRYSTTNPVDALPRSRPDQCVHVRLHALLVFV